MAVWFSRKYIKSLGSSMFKISTLQMVVLRVLSSIVSAKLEIHPMDFHGVSCHNQVLKMKRRHVATSA